MTVSMTHISFSGADSAANRLSISSVSVSAVPSLSVTSAPVKQRELTSPPDRSWSSDKMYLSQPEFSCSSTHSYSAARSPYLRPLSPSGCSSSRVR